MCTRVRRLLRAVVLCIVGVWLVSAGAYALDPGPLPMPVDGLRTRHIRSSFHAPRPRGRRHQGIDLFARRGTPVHPAGHAVVVRVGVNRLGGNFVHTVGRGGLLCYYAHLSRHAEGLRVGSVVGPDDVLGYVGTTGNARGKAPHLHFETRPLALGGVAVDPYRLLRGG